MRAATVLLMTLSAASAVGAAAPKPVLSEDAHFRRWLTHYLKTSRDDFEDNDLQNLVYGYALIDLNGDGRNEAVVWSRDAGWCGSSGCDFEVFVHRESGWRYFADGVNTRLPIKVLLRRTHGWRDLSGWQYGGAVDRPFESWIQFDGRDYGWAKTGWKVPKRMKGRTIIKAATIPLFPDKCQSIKEAPSIFGPMPIKSGKPGSC